MTGAHPEPSPYGPPASPSPYGPPPTYGPPQQPPPAYGPPPMPPPGYGPPQQPPPGYGPPPMPPPQKSGRNVVAIMAVVVGVLLVACLAGVAGVWWYLGDRKDKQSDTSAEIPGVLDYRRLHPEWLARDHRDPGTKIDYPMVPAAGGPHHPVWQRCLGDVYTSPIDEGNAVHSLEHGAVWITYQPSLPAADVAKLAARVRGNDFMMLSPYPDQPTPISLQAWGYQLHLSRSDDKRIDEFIKKYRETASLEPGVPCSTGTTDTGTAAAPSPTD